MWVFCYCLDLMIHTFIYKGHFLFLCALIYAFWVFNNRYIFLHSCCRGKRSTLNVVLQEPSPFCQVLRLVGKQTPEIITLNSPGLTLKVYIATPCLLYGYQDSTFLWSNFVKFNLKFKVFQLDRVQNFEKYLYNFLNFLGIHPYLL